MSTTGVLSVASCVSAIVDVLADSAKLLRHVRKSDEARFEALEASLYLGSTLLRTLYEADYRRFGEVLYPQPLQVRAGAGSSSC
ncbi:hypothetical protein VTN31DRAFT_676 [Thermomyces dupontii]|uniref:uncharacterized protein n=1 Tax=Talaromyces thermophilus TaxID=28565 RepID=UPI003742C493